MILVIGWEDPRYEKGVREAFMAAVAGLCSQSSLTGLVVSLPSEPEHRQWIFYFLSSVKRRAAIRTGVLITASTMSQRDISACEEAGVDEVVILHESANGPASMDSVYRYISERPGTSIGIRVWLKDAAPGTLQTQVAAWTHATRARVTIEIAPFGSQEVNSQPSRHAVVSRPLPCDWLRSVITMTDSGAIIACPLHACESGPRAPVESLDEVIERHAALLDSAGATRICGSCRRLVRVIGSDLAQFSPNLRSLSLPYEDSVLAFHDHVGCDASTLSLQERHEKIASFATRIGAVRQERSR